MGNKASSKILNEGTDQRKKGDRSPGNSRRIIRDTNEEEEKEDNGKRQQAADSDVGTVNYASRLGAGTDIKQSEEEKESKVLLVKNYGGIVKDKFDDMEEDEASSPDNEKIVDTVKNDVKASQNLSKVIVRYRAASYQSQKSEEINAESINEYVNDGNTEALKHEMPSEEASAGADSFNKEAVEAHSRLKCSKCKKRQSREGCTQDACLQCCSDGSCEKHRKSKDNAMFRDHVLTGTTSVQLLAKEQRAKAIRPGRFHEPGFQFQGDTIVIWNIYEYMGNPKWRDDAVRKSIRRRARDLIKVSVGSKRKRKSLEEIVKDLHKKNKYKASV